MKRILEFLRPLIRLNFSHPYIVVTTVAIVSAISATYAIQLKVDTDIANLLPDDNPHVKALNMLKETVGGETTMEVAIQSPSFEANKEFARDLIDEALELYDPRTENPFFSRAEFRKETEILKDNALYLATPSELEDIKEYLQDEIEQAKLEANPFYFDVDDEESEKEGDKIKDFEASYNALIPPEYAISPDSTVLKVEFYPTGSKSDITYLQDMFAAFDSLLVSMEPQQYQADMNVVFGGRLKRHLAQLDSIMQDVISSFASGISSVILLVMLYFSIKKWWNARGTDYSPQWWQHLIRMPIPILIIGLPLLMSLFWTFGITYGVLGILNTMTSVLFVILFGLGIDYGIHFYARYIELRAKGEGVEAALMTAYQGTGTAILTSAVTTASALYILMFADFKGFSEFGFIAGTGILLALLAMLFVLPAFVTLFERWGWILINDQEETNVLVAAPKRFPIPRVILVIGLVIAALVAWNNEHLKFQYEFGELEPEFPEYDAYKEIAGQVNSNGMRNPAYIVADNDDEVLEILDTLRTRMRLDTLSPTIADVEALQERFPPNEQAEQEKLDHLVEIRALLQDPFIKDQDDEQLNKLRRAAQTTEPLTIDQIPDYLKNKFITKDNEIGRFVIIYPGVGLSDGRQSIAFKHDVGQVTLSNGKTYHAASTSIVAAEMLEHIHDESPYMVIGTFILVFIFMLFAFRSLRWSLISMLPLIVGLTWLFGIMMLIGLMFNFYNLVVLPAILGIGEDNGVHLAHRYRDEGPNSMWRVISSTGQHITVGSLTTMLGFAGLLFTNHPGLRSLGEMATIGIGMTLLSAVTFLPALIQWLEDRDWIRFH
ncbi:MAG: efflux RND transporter permease subunit [Bacteroidota bacterium]